MDRLERFALGVDADLHHERDTNRKWREAQKLAAPINRKELLTSEGTVLDGAVLLKLYEQRDRAEKKKEAAREARVQRMSRKNKVRHEGYQSILKSWRPPPLPSHQKKKLKVRWRVRSLPLMPH